MASLILSLYSVTNVQIHFNKIFSELKTRNIPSCLYNKCVCKFFQIDS